jgi:hypothetical protein
VFDLPLSLGTAAAGCITGKTSIADGSLPVGLSHGEDFPALWMFVLALVTPNTRLLCIHFVGLNQSLELIILVG